MVVFGTGGAEILHSSPSYFFPIATGISTGVVFSRGSGFVGYVEGGTEDVGASTDHFAGRSLGGVFSGVFASGFFSIFASFGASVCFLRA